nr:hypothetical protein [uncultured Lachnoclostridium sp.]
MKFEREILRIHSDKESVEKIITFIKAYEEKINKQLDDFTSNDLEEMLKGSSIHTVVRVENFIKTYFDMYESFLNNKNVQKGMNKQWLIEFYNYHKEKNNRYVELILLEDDYNIIEGNAEITLERTISYPDGSRYIIELSIEELRKYINTIK